MKVQKILRTFKLINDSDEEIGKCIFTKIQTNEKFGGKRYTTLWDLEIAEEWQGKGLGEYFMREIIKNLKGEVDVINLCVKHENSKAINLYKKLGFVIWASSWNYFDMKLEI